MIKTITSNDVLRYFYGEISKHEKNEIEEVLAFDSELQTQYCDIEEVNRKLNKVTLSPNDAVIDSILTYSHSFLVKN